MNEKIKGCVFLRKSDIGYGFFPLKAKYHILGSRVSIEDQSINQSNFDPGLSP